MRLAKLLMWLLPALILLLALVTLYLQGWLRQYLRSEAFRETVSAKTSAALQVSGQFSPLEWTGASVFSSDFTALEGGRGPVASLRARNVRAIWNWRSLFSGTWELDDIEIAALEVTLQPRTRAQGAPTEQTHQAEAHQDQRDLPGWVPRRFAMGAVAIQFLHARYHDAALRGGQATLEQDGDSWNLTVRGGSLEWPGFPPNDLTLLRARAREGGFYLTEARLLLREGGTMDISGEIRPDHQGYDFLVKWEGIPASSLLPDGISRHLMGSFGGEMRITGGGTTPAPPLFKGDFSLTDGQLRGIPILQALSTFTGSPRFERVPVSRLDGKFTYQTPDLSLQEVILESTGLVKVEGHLVVHQGDLLSGLLEVGLTPQTLQWIPGSRERVFTEARTGYRWTPVKISGTVSDPREDLSERLLRAAGEQVLDGGRQAAEGAVDQAVESIRGVLDILRPLID